MDDQNKKMQGPQANQTQQGQQQNMQADQQHKMMDDQQQPKDQQRKQADQNGSDDPGFVEEIDVIEVDYL